MNDTVAKLVFIVIGVLILYMLGCNHDLSERHRCERICELNARGAIMSKYVLTQCNCYRAPGMR